MPVRNLWLGVGIVAQQTAADRSAGFPGEVDMKRLRLPLCLLFFGAAFAVLAGGEWQMRLVGGLFGMLVGAMLETMPLRDWLYPTGDKDGDSRFRC